MQADVAIVGAGPIGLVSARAAAEGGAQTLVVEKKPEGAPPSCCAGLVSPRTLATLGVSSQSVLQEIRALRLHLPSGRQIDFRSNRLKAVTIDRRRLERELLLKARDAGAEVQFNAEATGACEGTLRVRSDSQEQCIRAAVIVGADGPRSRVASWFALQQPAHFVAAAQVELEGVSPQLDRVDVFLGYEVAPGFFGWSVPAENGILRVGLGVVSPHTPMAFLDQLLAKHFVAARIRSRCAGWIPLAPTPLPASPGVLLVGDAGGQVKPLSGGGLYTGGVCAGIAGETAAQIAKSNEKAARLDASAELLASYAARCLEAIGKEQAFGQSMRSQLSRLKDEDVEAAARVLADCELMRFLADEADIDFFHRLPDRLASEPRLWATLLRIVPLLGSLAD
jgi:digeranylgeranylglycerophospholipid reductase